MIDKEIMDRLRADYSDAEMVLIGVGSELQPMRLENSVEIKELLEYYRIKLEKKNYFIVTSYKHDMFVEAGYNRKRICNPLLAEESEDEAKQWDLYNKWLSATLNKKLLIIELGEDFNHPNIFRWPFENVVFINQKSHMYRINEIFYQLPEQICDRALSIPVNSIDVLKELYQVV